MWKRSHDNFVSKSRLSRRDDSYLVLSITSCSPSCRRVSITLRCLQLPMPCSMILKYVYTLSEFMLQSYTLIYVDVLLSYAYLKYVLVLFDYLLLRLNLYSRFTFILKDFVSSINMQYHLHMSIVFASLIIWICLYSCSSS